jgi:hypothetical protein
LVLEGRFARIVSVDEALGRGRAEVAGR